MGCCTSDSAMAADCSGGVAAGRGILFVMTVPRSAEPPGNSTATTCSACHERLTTYYTAGEFIIVCPACREQIVATQMSRSATWRFFRAVLIGALAAMVIAAGRYAFTRSIGWGLVAIAIPVGVVVGAWTIHRDKPLQFHGPFTR